MKDIKSRNENINNTVNILRKWQNRTCDKETLHNVQVCYSELVTLTGFSLREVKSIYR